MTYRGRVKNGVVILDPPACLPEGAEVEVVPTQQEQPAPTLAERYRDIIGIAEGLPADSSQNHDHYLYGTPKQ
ncbi:MAG: hypothetical protein QUV05_00060 [Phycisphaerae bacterium]|nr:hypothetical protein [Phycisphaerae bacterium]